MVSRCLVTQCLPLWQCLQSARYGHLTPHCVMTRLTIGSALRTPRLFTAISDNSQAAAMILGLFNIKMQNKHIFLFLEHPSESISRNVTTAAGVSSWAPPTTLQSPEAGSSRNVPVLWIVMVIPDNMILFTLAHTTSSWSQHRPRDIIMRSLPHQRDTKYAKKSRARASVSDRRAYHQNMRLLRPGSFSHQRETIQSLQSAASDCRKEIPIKRARLPPCAGDWMWRWAV